VLVGDGVRGTEVGERVGAGAVTSGAGARVVSDGVGVGPLELGEVEGVADGVEDVDGETVLVLSTPPMRPVGVAGAVGDGPGPRRRSPERPSMTKPPITSSADTVRVTTAARRDPMTAGSVCRPMCAFRRPSDRYLTRPGGDAAG
jgi:hypothetical protein